MQRFYETNRLNFKGDAIGPFDRLNECIRTYLLGNGENEKRFLEGLPTVMFFQLGFQEPMILCVTRRDFIDHTPRDAAYTTDSRWSGPAATKICNTVLMRVEYNTRHSYLLSESLSSSESNFFDPILVPFIIFADKYFNARN